MLIKTIAPAQLKESDVTDEALYLSRRRLLQGALLATLAPSAFAKPTYIENAQVAAPNWLQKKITEARAAGKDLDLSLTPFKHVTTHNNFYEFGMGKEDPARYGHEMKTDPWSISIGGEASKPQQFMLEDLLKDQALEERIYRLRCVEAWSMVIPWIGIPLSELLKRVEPKGSAKYVSFTSLVDPQHMRGQRSAFGTIDWPYREGLRMDEAMHPLTMVAVGLYGKALLPQNGAPIRLVVPWKYGFKSIKSIVKIELTERMPETTWNQIAAREYGFYANVNPAVSHPRWSQATERRLPSGLFRPNIRDTELFNGYANDVAGLYKGMDLTKWY